MYDLDLITYHLEYDVVDDDNYDDEDGDDQWLDLTITLSLHLCTLVLIIWSENKQKLGLENILEPDQKYNYLQMPSLWKNLANGFDHNDQIGFHQDQQW